MRSVRCFGLALSAAALLAGACSRSDPVMLRTKWAKGDVLRQRVTTEIRSKTTGTHQREMATKQMVVTRTTVQDVAPDGTSTLSSILESARMETDMPPAGKTVYDSTTGAEPLDLQSKLFAALVGLSMTTRMAPDGHLLETTGFDEARTRMTAVLKEQPGGEAIVAQMGSFLDPKVVTNWGPIDCAWLPAKPVRVGDTWEHKTTIKIPMMGTVETTATYKLASIDGPSADQVAHITVRQHIKRGQPEPTQPGSPLASMPTTETKDHDGRGEILFSILQGQVRSHKRAWPRARSSRSARPPINLSPTSSQR